MRLSLEMHLDNDAFNDGSGGACETARILRQLADSIDNVECLDEGMSFGLRDTNGNRVGAAKVED